MIIYSSRFYKELENITAFILKDSQQRALKFSDELFLKIENIPNHPLAYPEYKDNEFIRKLIYKKYVIPFEILKDDIYILGIFKNNLWSK
ncbi:type II toxin-antitoxin system RelE/ParE family toxin [Campylobacter ureolyticus]|uniref:Toxin-antitoxin system, toxin component, RelE/ParE family n=1 Tax=Campylobacter ureolyticus TaxID=827 RepID=A0A381E1P3_9BACT|nr:type II toxin-antitoxin system RelE/ParE family toxin [Campylobacter ureolyticus]MCR8685389.1 type II toxin-antitoxin system RelE/ParE family toxin [Campylobacter ureolyticus]MCZ6102652.1 type II toxin-antitoxin system RelE/ParE family toxin [Campylobacter ureolyticus]MCZ6134804.1 type II toxin-antitoxin system RelE/ParE family toxin [Campylobacter ureolyticus]MCZ6161565.1 type II toxin-antitoxin system RelE/ParE family toxin [Campylobacter ureolyticus]MCZ6170151.1 type II toxin-antitoxin s